MLEVTASWSRYLSSEFWWLHLMTAVWALFTLVLFVLEPLFLHCWFHSQAEKNSERAFAVLQWMHVVLFSLSLIAIVGAVAAAHGFHY
jgi:heme/copper-type cytochrome/quinol oxidase subunit 2